MKKILLATLLAALVAGCTAKTPAGESCVSAETIAATKKWSGMAALAVDGARVALQVAAPEKAADWSGWLDAARDVSAGVGALAAGATPEATADAKFWVEAVVSAAIEAVRLGGK